MPPGEESGNHVIGTYYVVTVETDSPVLSFCFFILLIKSQRRDIPEKIDNTNSTISTWKQQCLIQGLRWAIIKKIIKKANMHF